MRQFASYVQPILLDAADKLITHVADGGGGVIIEYEVHGTILATGATYNNQFCSIMTIENRRIAYWRDYLDSLAAWNSINPRAS
jgi:ketosteroid isomerase-like protein